MAAGHDLRVNLEHGKQLGRSLVLLAHYITVFVVFLVRSVGWLIAVIEWTTVFARHTVSVFDSIYRHLHWWRKKDNAGISKGICPGPDTGSK